MKSITWTCILFYLTLFHISAYLEHDIMTAIWKFHSNTHADKLLFERLYATHLLNIRIKIFTPFILSYLMEQLLKSINFKVIHFIIKIWMPAPHNIYYINNPSTANHKSKISKLLLPHNNNSNEIEEVKNEKLDLFVLYSLH